MQKLLALLGKFEPKQVRVARWVWQDAVGVCGGGGHACTCTIPTVTPPQLASEAS